MDAMTRDETTEAIMDMLKPDPWGQAMPTVPETGGTEFAGHVEAVASCSDCIRNGLTGCANMRETEEDETLGPCGCTDYHMSDCPTRTGGSGMTSDDYLARWERDGYRDYPEDW